MFTKISEALNREVNSFDDLSNQDLDFIENKIFSLLNELDNTENKNQIINNLILYNQVYNFMIENGF
tara:strand:+ start:363 stop:563 length:201 start_codon:yes stop_codon:yes gene_type:complete